MWARQSYRLSDYELKAASRDGYGEDWPISYSDLAPYYDKVDEFVGISGSYENLPQLPDGKFLPPMNMTCGEWLLKRAVEKHWKTRKVIIGRTAILTQNHNGRAKCHYCGHCDRGCTTSSYYSSPGSTLPAAEKTGRMTLRPNSVASHVIVDTDTGKAKGVAYIDQNTKEGYEAFGRVIVLCASTLESTRLLLNSATRQYPAGLGNSSGVLGHYLVDHFGGTGASGVLPMFAGRDTVNEDGKSSGVFIPRFRNLDKETKHPKFLRGYGFEGGSAIGSFPGMARRIEGFGSEFKRQARRWYVAPVGLTTRAAMLSRYENYVEIDPGGVVDAWGIPVLRVHIQHSDNEREMGKDAAEMAAEILTRAGAEEIGVSRQLTVPGRIIHELGTARMGADPKKSVLNKFNQMWDAKNVFVTDGAAYVGSANQNPTLTILALTIRACEYLTDEMGRGNL